MDISSYSSSDFIDNTLSIDNRTLPLIPFNYFWILPLFILSLLGIFVTIIILFLFLYYSIRRLNNHLILTNLFLCFSVCFLYVIVIFFLIRGNELFCGLREFLSQFAYALLYSALLCRYIMQWLATRILSKRTKQLTSLLIYVLLICIQIPIGILWWYFTIPRVCQQQQPQPMKEYPRLKFQFRERTSSEQSCSYQCTVDYRFYATYAYTILELFLCTIIAVCLFLCRSCPRHTNDEDQMIKTKNHKAFLEFLNMLAFVLIDAAWLVWTLIYYFTPAFFVFPSLVIGMFTIGTICLFFILVPQIYSYSKIEMNDANMPVTTLFTNKLASTDDVEGPDALLHEQDQQRNRFNENKQQILTNGSELSYELGASGTFLPLTRTPKGPFKVTNTEKTTLTEKLDQLIYGEQPNTTQQSSDRGKSPKKQRNNHPSKQFQPSLVPSQRLIPSSNPVLRIEDPRRSNANIHPSLSHVPPHHDETIIPILCSSQHQDMSTPVKMRILIKSPPSSVPTKRRLYSGTDHRRIQYSKRPILSSPLSPAKTPLFYSPTKQQQQQQQYYFIDPYRSMPSSHYDPYSCPRFHMDHRSLSQRLWDIDSEDDEDGTEDHFLSARGRTMPTTERWKDFRSSHIENDDHTILPIDDDDDDNEEKLSNRKLVFI